MTASAPISVLPTGETPTTKPRKPRSDRGGLRLNRRDEALLLTLFENQAMARGQIETCFFGSTARCNARLGQLLAAEYLCRHYLPVPPGGSVRGAQAIYTSGRAALPLIAQKTELSLAEVRKRSRPDRTPLYLTHALQIVQFRIAVTHALKMHPNWKLDLWVGEQDARHQYDIRKTPGTGSKRAGGSEGAWRREVFRPDGYFRVLSEDGTDARSFFVEIDLGHTSGREFRTKLRLHQRYGQSGMFSELYGEESFHTLVVSTSERRLENLCQLAAEAETRFVRLATLAEAERNVLGAIWHVPGSPGCESLLEARPDRD